MLSIRRTRLTPTSLEICMCLKDHLDATDRIQHTLNLKNSIEFKETILDEEVLANETLPLFDEEIAPDEAASEARCACCLRETNKDTKDCQGGNKGRDKVDKGKKKGEQYFWFLAGCEDRGGCVRVFSGWDKIGVVDSIRLRILSGVRRACFTLETAELSARVAGEKDVYDFIPSVYVNRNANACDESDRSIIITVDGITVGCFTP
ncbi:hypothetical protein Tco_1013129 [Tanacetum coccineum]